MNQDNNQKRAPEEDLGKTIEREVTATINTVAAAVQDVMREVGESLRENTASGTHNLGATIREGVDNMRKQASEAGIDKWFSGGSAVKKRPGKFAKQMNKKYKDTVENTTAGFMVAAIMLGVSFVAEAAAPILLAIGACFLAGGIFSAFKIGRARRAAAYAAVLDNRSYCTIDELSAATYREPDFVRADIQRLLRANDFTGMYLSPDCARLFTNATAYRLYMAEMEKAGADAPQPLTPETSAQDAQATQPTQPDEMQSEGQMFLQQLRAQKQRIDDAAARAQVEQIEQHVSQIFAWLEKHPGSVSQVRRFTSYYLPTTLKLLATYNDVDAQAEDSAVAGKIQQDICDILHKINDAFQTLQDGLLKDTALDVSAEISALETVMAQDGLSQDEISFHNGGL